MSGQQIFDVAYDGAPVVAMAIHNGHYVRRDIAEILALTDSERLREEDPFTGEFANVSNTRLIGLRSRFEFDANRPRDECVYLSPEQAWGLKVWREPPSSGMVQKSLEEYDLLYEAAEMLLNHLVDIHKRVVVLDLHTYNHRRNGPNDVPAPQAENPDINIGTGTMDRAYWAELVDRFTGDLRGYNYLGRRLDVRENVKFFGGNLCRWIHRRFPASVCSLAVEVKKFFMDEWTGQPDRMQIQEVIKLLRSALPGLRISLRHMDSVRPNESEIGTR